MSSQHFSFDAVFLPCSDAASQCAVSSPWFFGSGIGQCNVTTQLCACPDGFTGIDDVATYNDCHINTSFRTACHAIVLITSILAAVVSLGGLVKLTIKWGVVSWGQAEVEEDKNKTLQWNKEKSELRTRDISATQQLPRSPRAMPNSPSGPLMAIAQQQAHQSLSHSSTAGPIISATVKLATTTTQDGHTSVSTTNTNPSPPRPKSLKHTNSPSQSAPAAPLLQLQTTMLSGKDDPNPNHVGRQSTSDNDSLAGEDETRTPQRKKSRAPRVSIKPMQQPKTNVRSSSYYQDVSLAKRRRNTCFIMFGFATYSVCILATFACFSSFINMSQRNAGLLVVLSGALASFQFGIWILAYSWCGSLQSMKGYARMFPSFARHPLIRFPWLPSIVTTVCLLISFVCCVVFFLCLPLQSSQDALQGWIVPVGLTMIAVIVLALTLFETIVFSLLLKMFATYTTATKNGSQTEVPIMNRTVRKNGSDIVVINGNDGGNRIRKHGSEVATINNTVGNMSSTKVKVFAKARRTVLYVLVMGCLSGPFVAFFVLIGAWTLEGRRHMYFFFSALFSLANIVVLFSSYVVVYRISSSSGNGLGTPMSPQSKTRKQGSKLNSSQQPQPNYSEATPNHQTNNAVSGPLVLTLRQSEMQSKESTVQIS